jgi:hypothetical protein
MKKKEHLLAATTNLLKIMLLFNFFVLVRETMKEYINTTLL